MSRLIGSLDYLFIYFAATTTGFPNPTSTGTGCLLLDRAVCSIISANQQLGFPVRPHPGLWVVYFGFLDAFEASILDGTCSYQMGMRISTVLLALRFWSVLSGGIAWGL
ncbi:hypothetical protein TB2_018667 [Malus domestica]